MARCADSIGATTIAEAVETSEQLQICHDLKIPLGQGYYSARPGLWQDVRAISHVHGPLRGYAEAQL